MKRALTNKDWETENEIQFYLIFWDKDPEWGRMFCEMPESAWNERGCNSPFLYKPVGVSMYI
jgi:hypothetical protein